MPAGVPPLIDLGAAAPQASPGAIAGQIPVPVERFQSRRMPGWCDLHPVFSLETRPFRTGRKGRSSFELKWFFSPPTAHSWF